MHVHIMLYLGFIVVQEFEKTCVNTYIIASMLRISWNFHYIETVALITTNLSGL
jgi:hypothetical protein